MNRLTDRLNRLSRREGSKGVRVFDELHDGSCTERTGGMRDGRRYTRAEVGAMAEEYTCIVVRRTRHGIGDEQN
jgi:hypothetical protein